MVYTPMINNETGEIDMVEITKRAPARAEQEWRGTNYPPKYLREAIDWLKVRAEAESRQWRRDHGIPISEEAGGTVTMPSWGASGDSYGVR